MSSFGTDHRIEDIAVRDTRVSDAIDEPMRAMILDILSEEALTATEVHDCLGSRGIDRTKNTVRHHINELRDAGLVDVVRFEEGRGGTTKYYHANTIVLSSLPDSADSIIEEMIDNVQPQIMDALATLTDEYDDEIEDIVTNMQPCEHCRTQKYETYVLLTVLRLCIRSCLPRVTLKTINSYHERARNLAGSGTCNSVCSTNAVDGPCCGEHSKQRKVNPTDPVGNRFLYCDLSVGR